MSPPIPKDWWIAAALTSATLPAAVAQPAPSTMPAAGVVSAVTPNSPASSSRQTVAVGNNVLPGERFRTGPNGQLHVLFLDQSALTLGADSEVVIEAFNFDPETKQGQIRLGLTKGLLRIVGGQISKTNATVISTPHGKIEILGGITIAETDGQKTSGVFLFGQSMRMTDNNGNTATVTRPGFGTSLTGNGVTTPQRSAGELNSLLARLEPGNQQSGQDTGGRKPPPPSNPQIFYTTRLGGSTNPGDTLANDRLKGLIDNYTGSNPSQTLRNILASGQTPNQS